MIWIVLVSCGAQTWHRFQSSFHLEPDRTFRLVIPVAGASFRTEHRSGALYLGAFCV